MTTEISKIERLVKNGQAETYIFVSNMRLDAPVAMVDRIVPAAKPDDIATIQNLSGIVDAAPVLHEPFSQWVVSDEFRGDVPDLGKVGVQIVPSVAPFETMKLRMLNGAHSALAYLGITCRI